MWRKTLHPAWAEIAGCLVIRNTIDGQTAFDYPVPCPEGDEDAALSAIEAYCLEKGVCPVISVVPECKAARLLARYPYVRVSNIRTWRDYVYYREDLQFFAGRRYSGQRNHIKKFRTQWPEALFRPLTAADGDAVDRFWTDYEAEFPKGDNAKARDELALAKKMLKMAGKPWFLAGGMFDGDRLIALSLAERCGDTLIIHIEKALYSYTGVYPALVQEFAGAFGGDCQWINREDDAADRQYIESCFGPSLLPARELGLAEQALCAGIHLGCRLWYTAGVPRPERAKNPEARRVAEQALLQAERNRAAFSADAALYQNAILRLTERIQNCLQVYSETETETARRGRLDPARVWRAAVLGDQRVFQREEPSNRPGFAVDLLLDASASRLHCQETVAAQGYILAESLGRCGVPVRVSGFCSLRGYTVLRVLKDFGGQSRGVFRYFASGWNRDGLALRAAGTLLEGPPDRRRILLVLTDASPNDSRRIPPGGAYPLGHDYDGAPAVKDAAREVRALERRGVRVGAVFMGPAANIPAAESIYGQSLARIRTMDQLAGAAGTLIQREIRELEG